MRESLRPGQVFGAYELGEPIGSGAMAEVFGGRHRALGKPVAIKVLRRNFAEMPDVVTRFLHEGEAAARIRHRHICDVTDVGIIDGLPYLVMEFLDGEDMRTVFDRRVPSITELVDWLLPVFAAVNAAHEGGIVHRDLKPENIFLARGSDGQTLSKVLDFGISRAIDARDKRLTAPDSLVGTPHYLSPEQARGDDDEPDPRVDQYALEVVLYEGLTGRWPFPDEGSVMKLLYKISEGKFEPPSTYRPNLPGKLEAVVIKLMAYRPEDRFASLIEAGAHLLPFASSRARAIWTPTFGNARDLDVRRSALYRRPSVSKDPGRGRLIAVAAVAVALLAVGLLLFWQATQTEAPARAVAPAELGESVDAATAAATEPDAGPELSDGGTTTVDAVMAAAVPDVAAAPTPDAAAVADALRGGDAAALSGDRALSGATDAGPEVSDASAAVAETAPVAPRVVKPVVRKKKKKKKGGTSIIQPAGDPNTATTDPKPPKDPVVTKPPDPEDPPPKKTDDRPKTENRDPWAK